MKRGLSFTAVLCCSLMFSQVSISKNRLEKNGETYKFKDYEQVFSNEEARAYFKKAKANRSVANILGFCGGFGIGFGVAGALFTPKESTTQTIIPIYDPYTNQNIGGNVMEITRKNNRSGYWITAGIGAGLVAIAIPIANSAQKNATKAINLENGEATAFKPYFKIENSGNGIAFSYIF